MDDLNLSSIFSFSSFLHKNKISSNYCYKINMDNYLNFVRHDEKFCLLMSKISKKYTLENSLFDINRLCHEKDPREYIKKRTLCLKNTLSKKAEDEIRLIYSKFKIVTDKNLLYEMEKMIDIKDLALISKSVFKLNIMPKNFISDFNIDMKKFEEKNEDYFYHTALKIYCKDRYYFFKPYGFSDKFLQSQRLKNIYFHILCE